MANKNVENQIKTHGKGWLKIVKGIHIVSVEGSDYEMGYQYGKLLEKECMDGGIMLFSDYADITLRHSRFGRPTILRKAAISFLEFFIKRPLTKIFTDEDIQYFQGMSDALGFSKEWAKNNIIQIDFFMKLPTINFGSKPEYLRMASSMGCTSFGASPKATKSGHTISGHNKDFAAMEYWDKYQVVTFHKPDKGYRYLHLCGAGIPSTTPVSFNEHGLCISGHVIMTNDVKNTGVPVSLLGDRIIRTCKDTKSAVDVLSKLHTPTAWKIHIIDKKGIHAVVEISATKNEHYYVKDVSGCANVFKAGPTKSIELNFNQSMMNNYTARQERMEMLLKKHFGKITPELSVKFLEDRFDIFTETERPVGNVIGQMTNLNSIIFDHSEMKFWVASGRAPVCDNVYRGFTFDCGYSGKFNKLPKDIKSSYYNSKLNKGVRECVYANNSHFIDFNLEKSISHLSNAEKYTPEEVIYPLLKALVLLQSGKYDEGLKSLEKASKLKHEPNKAHIILLWMARCHDLMGNRKKALQLYGIVIKTDGVFNSIKKSAQRGMKARYKKSSLKNLPIDFWLGDTLDI